MESRLISSIFQKTIRHDRVSCSCKPLARYSKSCFINVIAALLFLFCINITMGQPHAGLAASSVSSNPADRIALSPEIGNGNEESRPRDLGELEKDGALKPASKTIFFGEDTHGVPIVVGTWFRYGSYTLAFAMFGTGFLVSCVAAAIYYVLFVVTEPSQQVRSMRNEDSWHTGRILKALQIALDTYQTFDPYSPVCQLKTVCEIQESGYFQGSALKRMFHFIVHTDLIEKRLENASELRAADRIGNDPKEKCSEKFSGCRFSLHKIYERYMAV